jgi:hypothetical protein
MSAVAVNSTGTPTGRRSVLHPAKEHVQAASKVVKLVSVCDASTTSSRTTFLAASGPRFST